MVTLTPNTSTCIYMHCGMNCTATDNCMEELDFGGMEVTTACFDVQQGLISLMDIIVDIC